MPRLERLAVLVTVLLLAPAPVLGASGATVPGVQDVVETGDGPYDVIVTFRTDPTEAARTTLARWSPTVDVYASADAAHVTLERSELAALDRVDGVARVDPDDPLEYTLDSSKRVVRADRSIEDLPYEGEGVGVAIVDSGIDQSHPGLEDQVVANVRVRSDGTVVPITEDHEGHGTHVAGIVAGTGARSPSGSHDGVAEGAHLVGVDVSDEFTTSTVLAAYDWIIDHKDAYNIRVVSASWGRTERSYSPSDPIVKASSELVEHGIVVVYSAGNEGPSEGSLSVEAQNPDVITVGAVDDSTEIATFSSRGPADGDVVKPDVVAPGVDITSTKALADPGGLVGSLLGDDTSSEQTYYASRTGTSQASPHVAGIAALLISADPSISPAGVKAILKETAADLGPEGPDPSYGHGLADAEAALHLALGREPPDNVLTDGGQETYTFRGEVSGADGPAVQTYPTFRSHADGVAEASFPVKPGASKIRVTFSWRPADADFEVYLSDGARTFGPYTDAERDGDRRTITVTRSEGVEQGEWSVLADPGGVRADYRTTATVSYAPASSQSDRGTPRPGPDVGPAVILTLVGATGAMLVAVVVWRRRRGAATG